MNELFTNIARLGIKMRVYRAIQMADSDAGTLKDREILILELLKIQGAMSMTQLSHFFPGVNLSNQKNRQLLYGSAGSRARICVTKGEAKAT